VYEEKLTSNRTEVLFIALMILFLLLFAWRVLITGFGVLAIVFFCVFIFFLFYSFNYRTLTIRLIPETLILKFGIFTWTIPFENIEKFYLDTTSMWRIGGAGIHFTLLQGKYRAMFNFLEYPRLVVTLKKKKGPVREIAFSTKQPDEIIRILQEVVEKGSTA
jgi:hypothetical protein